MDFNTAWLTASVGDYITVSDGTLEPSKKGGPAWFMWRSHNFTGELIEKKGSAPSRLMTFELSKQDGAIVSYTIHEMSAHQFEPSTLDVFQNG